MRFFYVKEGYWSEKTKKTVQKFIRVKIIIFAVQPQHTPDLPIFINIVSLCLTYK